jgi:hypothetical protein
MVDSGFKLVQNLVQVDLRRTTPWRSRIALVAAMVVTSTNSRHRSGDHGNEHGGILQQQSLRCLPRPDVSRVQGFT